MWKEGPPGGRALPGQKMNLADEEGGVFGEGASGSGQPPSGSGALSQQNVRELYEIQAEEGDAYLQVCPTACCIFIHV